MKSLILNSGGLKSLFLTSFAAHEGNKLVTLFFDHSQVNVEQERVAAQKIAEYYKGDYIELNIRPTFDPSEPLINILYMLSLALPIARNLQCHEIYHGLSKDCWMYIKALGSMNITEQFLTSLRNLLLFIQPQYDGYGKYYGTIEIELPLYRLTLPRIIKLGNEWNTPWEMSISCEKGYACGQCPKCFRRDRAFLMEEATRKKNREMKGVSE